jgi:hypothetical protein
MNEEYCVGYAEGYQTGWNEAMDEKTARAAAMSVAWVGLTPEDYDSMRPRVPYIVNDFTFADVAAIVEAKLKEKNK